MRDAMLPGRGVRGWGAGMVKLYIKRTISEGLLNLEKVHLHLLFKGDLKKASIGE